MAYLHLHSPKQHPSRQAEHARAAVRRLGTRLLQKKQESLSANGQVAGDQASGALLLHPAILTTHYTLYSPAASIESRNALNRRSGPLRSATSAAPALRAARAAAS